MNPASAVLAAAHEAVAAQKRDDDRAENVACIFIEDAMRSYELSQFQFTAVEAEADRLWARRKRSA